MGIGNNDKIKVYLLFHVLKVEPFKNTLFIKFLLLSIRISLVDRLVKLSPLVWNSKIKISFLLHFWTTRIQSLFSLSQDCQKYVFLNENFRMALDWNFVSITLKYISVAGKLNYYFVFRCYCVNKFCTFTGAN